MSHTHTHTRATNTTDIMAYKPDNTAVFISCINTMEVTLFHRLRTLTGAIEQETRNAGWELEITVNYCTQYLFSIRCAKWHYLCKSVPYYIKLYITGHCVNYTTWTQKCLLWKQNILHICTLQKRYQSHKEQSQILNVNSVNGACCLCHQQNDKNLLINNKQLSHYEKTELWETVK